MWPWGTKVKPTVKDEQSDKLQALCTQLEQVTQKMLQVYQDIQSSVKPMASGSQTGAVQQVTRFTFTRPDAPEKSDKTAKPPRQRSTRHAPLLHAIAQLNERQSLVVLKNEEMRKYHPTGIMLNTKSKNMQRVLVWIVSRYYNEMAARNNWPRKELQLASTPHCWYIICHTSIPAAEKR